MPRRLPPLDQLQPRRICLIKPSALGDVVQTLPIASMLRERFPKAHLAWVVKASLAELLEGHPDINQVIRIAAPRGRVREAAAFLRLLGHIRRQQFELVIDLQGLFRSGLMTWASGAPRRLGMSTAREGATLAYTDSIEIPYTRLYAVEGYRRVVAMLGCQGEPPPPRLPLTDQHRAWAASQLAGLPRPILAVHPGAQWETKRYPPRQFAQLVRQAQADHGAGVVLVGGPGEGGLCAELAAGLRHDVVNLAEQTCLLQLAAVSQAADVFLSGDTGPMHLAAAVGTPVVAIFTCTSPLRVAPRGPQHRVVATGVACAASYRKTCTSLACMQELTPRMIWPALDDTLRRAVQAPRRRAG
jgi:lipopolysaccharide heptosyltransferase I